MSTSFRPSRHALHDVWVLQARKNIFDHIPFVIRVSTKLVKPALEFWDWVRGTAGYQVVEE